MQKQKEEEPATYLVIGEHAPDGRRTRDAIDIPHVHDEIGETIHIGVGDDRVRTSARTLPVQEKILENIQDR